MKRYLVSLIILLFVSFGSVTRAQDFLRIVRPFVPPNSSNQTSTLLFQSNSLLNLIIITDLRGLFRERREKPQSFGGRIFYFNKDSIPLFFEMKLRQRGNFRRQKENCSTPPLFINFKKNSVAGSLFAGQDKVKLVTHCRERKRYEQYVLNEYLAYRIYNLVTEFSYKVRLAKITYIDNTGRLKPISRFGFFIESRDEFEKRTGVAYVETKNLHQEVVDRYQMTLITIFQYLIGNTDWSVPNRHNIDLYLGNSQNPLIPVTFDFDFSGLVNAPYAQPQPMLGINKVTTRLYRGFPRTIEEVDSVLELYKTKEQAMAKELWSLPSVEKGQQKEAFRFINSFFEETNSKNKAIRIFIDGSRNLE